MKQEGQNVIPLAPLRARGQSAVEFPLWPPSCVYFLLENDEIVYVGRTTQLPVRLFNHYRSHPFTSAYYIPYPKELLPEMERAWIAELRPRMNTLGVADKLLCRAHQCKHCQVITECDEDGSWSCQKCGGLSHYTCRACPHIALEDQW